MKATTATETAWKTQDLWAKYGDQYSLAIQDLRRRVEALEQRATTEESSAHEPAPAADRPKPPSLKEQAIADLRTLAADLKAHGLGCNTDTINRALEALSDD